MSLQSYKRDDRPQRHAWAPGNYCNNCCTCKAGFIGDKRALSCADCAYAEPDVPTGRNIVMDYLNLRLSQRREISEWVGVKREHPLETDFEFCTRVLTTARDTGKLTELGEKAAAFLAEETR